MHMEVLKYTNRTLPDTNNLFVLMRGLGRNHRSFESEGMVEAVATRQIPFDMVAPNASFNYYSRRTLVERLRFDVILPAKEQGYSNIWLVGISMGGLGSMFYLKEQPQDIDGVYLISPFLGYNTIVDEILMQGGLANWTPGLYDAMSDWDKTFWYWIKEVLPLDKDIPVFLGLAEGDKYVKGQKLLAEHLPEERVNRIKGTHDFTAFTQLWIDFLDDVVNTPSHEVFIHRSYL